MKMVKTFRKTQHQHVMPPEKGKKERKRKCTKRMDEPRHFAKVTGVPGPQLRNVLEDEGRDGKTAFSTKHNTTHHLFVFSCSVT